MKKSIYFTLAALMVSLFLHAQMPVSVGSGSYASFVPLTKSRTSEHGGCQAYQMGIQTRINGVADQ